MRRGYRLAGLDASDVAPNPFVQFAGWLADAVAAGLREPNACVLATADSLGRPRARTVLLKGATDSGFTFFTNYSSTKGRHLATNPQASMCFSWVDLERQVIATGAVQRVSRTESDQYFHSRPHGSQLGALTSPQSEVVASRDELTERYAELERQYPEGTDVPAPDFWGGFLLVPDEVEFWQGRPNRLHDRVRYRKGDAGATWMIERLAP